jgi:hypothetical protein
VLIDSPAKKKPDRSLKSNRPGKKQGRLAQSPAGKLQVRKKTHSSRGVNTYRNFANDPMLLLPLSSPACNWLLFSVGGAAAIGFRTRDNARLERYKPSAKSPCAAASPHSCWIAGRVVIANRLD